jgi:hypothetical protein
MSDINFQVLKTEKPTNNFVKLSPMPKPDFSIIEKKESNFTYKEKGSYKKPKFNIPESPMKSPNQKYYTPVKTQSNLFGNMSTCRKLNFGAATDEAGTGANMLIEKFDEEESSPNIRKFNINHQEGDKIELISLDVEMADRSLDEAEKNESKIYINF